MPPAHALEHLPVLQQGQADDRAEVLALGLVPFGAADLVVPTFM
jgi:hypothetical protein